MIECGELKRIYCLEVSSHWLLIRLMSSCKVNNMSKFNQNDKAFVPVSKIKGMENYHSAFYETQVLEIADRKVKISLPGGGDEWIASSLVQKNIGILVLEIGDLQTETSLLDPLAKSVLQYCRLLLPDDYVRFHKIRFPSELSTIWEKEKDIYSHIVLIGHGKKNGIIFSNQGVVRPNEISSCLTKSNTDKVFISLCCQTGYKDMGGNFSRIIDVCSHFIAPFHSIHGAEASQFVQTFLAFHILRGNTVKTAFNNAYQTPDGKTFRLWEKGELKAGADLRKSKRSKS